MFQLIIFTLKNILCYKSVKEGIQIVISRFSEFLGTVNRVLVKCDF